MKMRKKSDLPGVRLTFCLAQEVGSTASPSQPHAPAT